MLPLTGVQVQSLLGELRSQDPASHVVWQKKKKKKKWRGVSEQEKTWGLHPDLDVPRVGAGDWEEEQSEVYNCTLKNVIRI